MWITKRHFLLCTACSLVIVATASGQTITSGIRLGLNQTTVTNAGAVLDRVAGGFSVDLTSKIGLTGGGFVKFDIGEWLAFQPELLFVAKGVKLRQTAPAGTMTATINYLEFPLLLRYTDYLAEEITGYVIAGPAFAFRAGSSAKLEAPNETRDLTIHPAITSRDTGISLGGGLQYERFLIDARYTLGLTDIATSAYEHTDSLKNRAFAVTVGMTVP